jgi:hypothetical protein
VYKGAFFLLLLLPTLAMGQTKVRFEGYVIEEKSLDAVPFVFIVNARNETGNVTNQQGHFEIFAEPGDTLVFSKPGYAYRYASARAADEVRIELLPQNYLLDEVPVTAYKLTSNLPKEMPLQNARRPEGGDIHIPQHVKPTLANPIDFLYDQFGHRPRQLRELQAILESESFRTKLAESENRSALFELTGLTTEKIEEFLLFCHYNESHIRQATDYDLLVSLLRCFDEFQAIQLREASGPNS